MKRGLSMSLFCTYTSEYIYEIKSRKSGIRLNGERGQGVGAQENRGRDGVPGGGRRKGGKQDSQSGGNREKRRKFRNIA